MGNRENEIELIDVVEAVVKWKWLILVVTCAGVGCGWFLSSPGGPDKFEASVLMLLRQRVIVDTKMQPKAAEGHVQEVKVSTPSYSEKFYESLALADDLKQALIDSLRLSGRVSSLDGVLQVEHVDETGMRLKVESSQRELAIRTVNAWAELFLRRNQGLSAEEVESFFDYVSNQYNRSRQLLEAAEDSLQIFEASNQVAELQRRVSILDTTSRVMHDTLMLLQLKKEELQAELQSAEQEVVALEIEGVPLSLANVSALKDTSMWPEIPHTRSVIVLMLKLDGYQSELRKLDRESEMWLAEFDAKYEKAIKPDSFSGSVHGLEDQKRRVRELQKIFHSLGDDRLDVEVKLRILKEIRQETVLQPSYKSPVTTEDDISVGERLQLMRKRGDYMEQYTMEKEELIRLIESLRRAYDVHLGNRLTGQVEVAALRPQLQNIQIQIIRTSKLLNQIQNQLQDDEEKLSLLLSRRQRLTRSQATYEGTFLRFSAILEETRVAREKAAGDIQILTRAIEARPVGPDEPRQMAVIGGALGLIISMFLLFLLEYVHKARNVRSELGT